MCFPSLEPRRDVLVVEDDDRMREGLVRALRRQVSLGVVRGAAGGVDGLRIARDLRPAVALIDHRLPQLSGLDVARVLRRERATTGIVVVLMTATPGEALTNAAHGVGAFAVVDKASSRRDICATVVRAVMRGTGPADRGPFDQVADGFAATSGLTGRPAPWHSPRRLSADEEDREMTLTPTAANSCRGSDEGARG